MRMTLRWWARAIRFCNHPKFRWQVLGASHDHDHPMLTARFEKNVFFLGANHASGALQFRQPRFS